MSSDSEVQFEYSVQIPLRGEENITIVHLLNRLPIHDMILNPTNRHPTYTISPPPT